MEISKEKGSKFFFKDFVKGEDACKCMLEISTVSFSF